MGIKRLEMRCFPLGRARLGISLNTSAQGPISVILQHMDLDRSRRTPA